MNKVFLYAAIVTFGFGSIANSFQENARPQPEEKAKMVEFSVPPSVISGEDRESILGKVEDNLNKVRSLKATFIQRGPEGNVDEGTIFLERPGKIRFEYADDNPILVVSNGDMLSFVDYEIKQVSRWPIDKTPLSVLVDDHIDLKDQDIEIPEMIRFAGLIKMSVLQPDQKDQGYITLIFEDLAGVLIGPLIYTYVKSLFEPSPGFFKKASPHFIFPALHFLSSIALILFRLSDFEEAVFIQYYFQFKYFLIAYSLFYFMWVYRFVNRYGSKIKQNYSSINDKDLTWVKKFLIGGSLIIGVDLFTSFYEIFVQELSWDTGYITVALMAIWIAYLGYNGISQARILLPDFLLPDLSVNNKSEPQKSVYNIEEMAQLEKRLSDLIQTKKPYLNEDLTLSGLAEFLQVTDKKLSALLNQFMDVSFYDYINSFRVEDVKGMIRSGEIEQYTLLGIAYECGFKSKTSFNRTFKKTTGLSPSAYKKQFN